MMWYVYLLRCADDTLYAGCTNDPPRRLQQHNAGQGAKYTRSRRPVSLVYLEQAGDHGQALRPLFPTHLYPLKKRRLRASFFAFVFQTEACAFFKCHFFAECPSSLAFSLYHYYNVC